jgi:hypothetical protein
VHSLITDAVYAAGYACSESAAAFRAVINACAAGAAGKNLVFGESECARLVAMLARTHGRALHADATSASASASSASSEAGWSLNVIVQTLMQMVRRPEDRFFPALTKIFFFRPTKI